jgi:hypothetical protein
MLMELEKRCGMIGMIVDDSLMVAMKFEEVREIARNLEMNRELD